MTRNKHQPSCRHCPDPGSGCSTRPSGTCTCTGPTAAYTSCPVRRETRLVGRPGFVLTPAGGEGAPMPAPQLLPGPRPHPRPPTPPRAAPPCPPPQLLPGLPSARLPAITPTPPPPVPAHSASRRRSRSRSPSRPRRQASPGSAAPLAGPPPPPHPQQMPGKLPTGAPRRLSEAGLRGDGEAAAPERPCGRQVARTDHGGRPPGLPAPDLRRPAGHRVPGPRRALGPVARPHPPGRRRLAPRPTSRPSGPRSRRAPDPANPALTPR